MRLSNCPEGAVLSYTVKSVSIKKFSAQKLIIQYLVIFKVVNTVNYKL